jgi:hypothetical protein
VAYRTAESSLRPNTSATCRSTACHAGVGVRLPRLAVHPADTPALASGCGSPSASRAPRQPQRRLLSRTSRSYPALHLHPIVVRGERPAVRLELRLGAKRLPHGRDGARGGSPTASRVRCTRLADSPTLAVGSGQLHLEAHGRTSGDEDTDQNEEVCQCGYSSQIPRRGLGHSEAIEAVLPVRC